MAQKDYVGRERSSTTQRKRNNNRRKNSKANSGLSKIIVGIAAAALVLFIGALAVLAHHKKQAEKEMVPHKTVTNGLPPKPEERWKYIKELENRQITVPSPVEPTAGGEVKSPTQLTDEQRQLLAQMAEDMRQQPTQLSEVPWNQQTPEQQEQTLRQQQQNAALQRKYQQQEQQFISQQQQLNQSRPSQSANRELQEQNRQLQLQHDRQQQAYAEQQKRLQLDRQQQLYRDQQKQRQQLERQLQQQQQHGAPITAAKPSYSQSERSTASASETVPTTPESSSKHWLIQCGSFKGAAQAESTRAKLAFEGFESRVTTGGGWNRVVIGPYNQRAKVDSVIKELKNSGHTNCITLSVGG
ncbi:cell division protein FtsN [Rosenbergiella australiborealis]|uniref:Cell division protein FtsN n=1 Tax=Rosenbergiella australiborealis TaxID=1544696 RepID=A0ABS5T7R0_9GAMM|nr:cell division protein FtsN [Rosenbergiella australiborealis]